MQTTDRISNNFFAFFCKIGITNKVLVVILEVALAIEHMKMMKYMLDS